MNTEKGSMYVEKLEKVLMDYDCQVSGVMPCKKVYPARQETGRDRTLQYAEEQPENRTDKSTGTI